MVRALLQIVLLLTAGAFAVPAADPPLKVAATHPIIADLVRQVGGGDVSVVDMIGLRNQVHGFEPTPGLLKDISDARLVLTSGKHLEDGWIGKLTDQLPGDVPVVEVGRRIPSLRIDASDAMFVCCPLHANGSLDPHWWHSLDNMIRATRIVADQLAETDPARADAYRERGRAYREQLETLRSWAKREIARIPRSDRELCTAHLAFAYFCKDFGFTAVPVMGLNQEQNPSPSQLAETIAHLRKLDVKAMFPEQRVNPKALQAIQEATGVRMGGILLADGPNDEHPTYIDMMRHNINTLTRALAAE